MNTAIYSCMAVGMLVVTCRFLFHSSSSNRNYNAPLERWTAVICLFLWTWQIFWLIPFHGAWYFKLGIWLAVALARTLTISRINNAYPDTFRLSPEAYLEEVRTKRPWFCCGICATTQAPAIGEEFKR
jgi:hypothetical protein